VGRLPLKLSLQVSGMELLKMIHELTHEMQVIDRVIAELEAIQEIDNVISEKRRVSQANEPRAPERG
jgi:hypothetical protein